MLEHFCLVTIVSPILTTKSFLLFAQTFSFIYLVIELFCLKIYSSELKLLMFLAIDDNIFIFLRFHVVVGQKFLLSSLFVIVDVSADIEATE